MLKFAYGVGLFLAAFCAGRFSAPVTRRLDGVAAEQAVRAIVACVKRICDAPARCPCGGGTALGGRHGGRSCPGFGFDSRWCPHRHQMGDDPAFRGRLRWSGKQRPRLGRKALLPCLRTELRGVRARSSGRSAFGRQVYNLNHPAACCASLARDVSNFALIVASRLCPAHSGEDIIDVRHRSPAHKDFEALPPAKVGPLREKGGGGT